MSKFALLFLLVFFGGIAAAIFYSGSAAFIVYQIVYFLNPDNRWWSSNIPGLRYSFITAVLMIVILAARYKEYSTSCSWRKQPVFIWMAALLAMYYIAYSYALVLPTHKQFTFDFTKLIIITFIAYKLIDSRLAFNASLWAYLIGCTYIGYLATITGRNAGARLEGIGMIDSPDANGTAAALVPAATILMYYAWQGSMKLKILAVMMGALIANGLVLINSRGSFLGVVLSLGLFLAYMLFSKYQKKGQRISAVLVIVLGISGGLYVTDDLFWERMSTLQNVEDTSTSGSSRIYFWLTTFDMLEDRPFGLGIWGFNQLAPYYMDEDTRGGVDNRSVHSSWFQGLSEVGWIGFGLFVIMLLSLYRQTQQAKKYLSKIGNYQQYFQILAVECSLFGYLISATFLNRFRSEILYWMILFLLVAIKLYYLQPKAREEEESKEVIVGAFS